MKKFLTIMLAVILFTFVGCTVDTTVPQNSKASQPNSQSVLNTSSSQEQISNESIQENNSSSLEIISSTSSETNSLSEIVSLIESSSSSFNSTIISSSSSSSKVSSSEISSSSSKEPSSSSSFKSSSSASSSSSVYQDPSVINLTTQTEHSAITYGANVVTVTKAGTYTFTGNYSGYMLINGVEGDVTIILDGVNIQTTEDQSTPAILFEANSYNRTLTIKDGSTNYLADSVGDIALVGDGAVINAKKSSLTINGGGSLELKANGEDTTCIKIKENLTINGPTISINATNCGIKAGKTLQLLNSNVSVTCTNDGIKTDNSPADSTEATTLASTETAGYLYIKNSNITITSDDNGITANNKMVIDNTDSNTISITTNGGTPETITGSNDMPGSGGNRPGGNWGGNFGGGSSSSTTTTSTTNGKALLVCGTKLSTTNSSGTVTETLYPCGFADYYPMIINGGKFEINSNDDAIHSHGDITITGGTLNVTSGDDGVHAEHNAYLKGGSLNVTKSYEALEGTNIYISGGNHTLYATDDGINAAYGDDSSVTCTVELTGGTTLVNADGDGLDAGGGDMGQENKGYIKLNGGTIYVCGTTSGGNGALDASTSVSFGGANAIVMAGSSAMEDSTPSGSYQKYTTSYSAGKTITVKDSSGNVVMQVTNPKSFGKMWISCSSSGWTYTVS